jgi:hypothetical protein
VGAQGRPDLRTSRTTPSRPQRSPRRKKILKKTLAALTFRGADTILGDMPGASLVSVALSAGVGAVVAFVGSTAKSYVDARRAIDVSLRQQREPAYRELWNLTRMFQPWSRSSASYADLDTLRDELAAWYFQGGGLYFSLASQGAYGRLQAAIRDVIEARSTQQETAQVLDPYWASILDRCSALRSELTNDLLSRRSARRLL